MATITAKLNLDASGFTAALTRAQASLGRIKAVGVPALAAGFATAAAAAGALAVGIKQAIDIGGALSDLSTRTGVAAGELRILQEAFARNGLEAGQVGPVINKLQKAIIEAGDGTGPAAEAFARMGLSLSEIGSLSSAGQLQAIGQAIAALPDPAARAATAMQLFGRSGGELLTLFANSGAMGQAAAAVGDQAALLTSNANMFDEASDILGQVGTKLQGLFVGIADQVVPVLMPLLEALDQVDLAGIGQGLGEGVSFALAAITSGQIGNLLAAQLKLAGAQFINNLMAGVQGFIAFLASAMQDIPSNFINLMTNGMSALWDKIAAISSRIAATLLDAVSNIPGLGGLGKQAQDLRGKADMLDTTSAYSAGEAYDVFAQSLAKAAESAGEAMAAAGEAINTAPLNEAINGIAGAIVGDMTATTASSRAKYEGTKTQFGPMDFEGTAKNNTGVIAQSLQKVGGGAAFARFSDAANPAAQAVREQQKSNSLLAKYLPLLERLAPQQPLMAS
jgi:hypothetical protein